MCKTFRVLSFIFFFICLFSFSQAQTTDSIRFVTYYPSPYGSYRELRAKRIAIGDDYIKGGTIPDGHDWREYPGDPFRSISYDADLVVQGNVGIGTTNLYGGVHIKKSGQALNLQTEDVNHTFDIQFYDADDLSGAFKWNLTYRSNNDPGDGSGPDALKLLNHGLGGTVMTWRYDGNVGIGTPSPHSPSPAPSTVPGNLDVNDIWLRNANGGAGAWLSAGGGFTPSAYTGGESVTFPNGMIMKMGYKATTLTSGTLAFNTPFPTNIVSVVLVDRGSIGHFEALIVSDQNKNGFSWTTYQMTDKTGFNWMAIGY